MKAARTSPLARDAMAYVLAGGRGSRLMELTDRRAKPAVYFGGKTRIVDFALSNAYNSGIRHIAVATQYKAHSLIRHLHRGWSFLRPIRNESFDVLPASQRISESLWYLGTADAVYQNIDIIESYAPQFLVVLAGDHVYKMDYEHMLQQHVNQNADVTVACIEVPASEASGFGVMDVDENDVIKSFIEKPKDPPSMPGKPGISLASMGIYVFETKFLCRELRRDAADIASTHDFGKDLIPYLVKNGKAVAHSFERSCVRSESESGSYWRDVGTIDAYWSANVDLTAVVPELDIYDQDWPIWTYNEITPPAKFVHDEDGRRGLAISSLVSGACIVSGATIRKTLLSTGARVNSFSSLESAVVLPYVDIGRSARLTNVVIDAGVKIPEGLVVGEDPILDAKRFRRTESGICLITQPMIDAISARANGHGILQPFEAVEESEDFEPALEPVKAAANGEARMEPTAAVEAAGQRPEPTEAVEVSEAVIEAVEEPKQASGEPAQPSINCEAHVETAEAVEATEQAHALIQTAGGSEAAETHDEPMSSGLKA
jgi:glucose-1-phosphate adenylyltransferase